MRLVLALCIALLAGHAQAWRSAAELSVADIDIEEAPLGTYGEGQTRGLLAAYESGKRALNTARVTLKNNLNCFDYNVGGASSVNQAFRLAMQDVGRAAAAAPCNLPPAPPARNGNYIFSMKTKCVAPGNGKTKVLTNDVTSINIQDPAKRACFRLKVDELIANGQYACFIGARLSATQQDWKPPGC